MQIIRFTFVLLNLVALLAHAAPTPTLIPDGSDSFGAREGDIDLRRRALIPVGSGLEHLERRDAGAATYALAPRSWDEDERHAQRHAEAQAYAQRHPSQGDITTISTSSGRPLGRHHTTSQTHANTQGHAVHPNPEPKSGGFKSKAAKAKKAIQRIWKKVTGKH